MQAATGVLETKADVTPLKKPDGPSNLLMSARHYRTVSR